MLGNSAAVRVVRATAISRELCNKASLSHTACYATFSCQKMLFNSALEHQVYLIRLKYVLCINLAWACHFSEEHGKGNELLTVGSQASVLQQKSGLP